MDKIKRFIRLNLQKFVVRFIHAWLQTPALDERLSLAEVQAAAYPPVAPKDWSMDDLTITDQLQNVEDCLKEACGEGYDRLRVDSLAYLQEAVVSLKLAIFKIKARS